MKTRAPTAHRASSISSTLEMSFVEQQDVLGTMEPVIRGMSSKTFGGGRSGDARIPPDPLRRVDGQIRLGQARPAQPD